MRALLLVALFLAGCAAPAPIAYQASPDPWTQIKAICAGQRPESAQARCLARMLRADPSLGPMQSAQIQARQYAVVGEIAEAMEAGRITEAEARGMVSRVGARTSELMPAAIAADRAAMGGAGQGASLFAACFPMGGIGGLICTGSSN